MLKLHLSLQSVTKRIENPETKEKVKLRGQKSQPKSTEPTPRSNVLLCTVYSHKQVQYPVFICMYDLHD